MTLSEPVREIRRIGAAPRAGAIGLAEEAIDAYVAACARPDDRIVALDILLRDLARLRRQEPGLDGLIRRAERYIDGLHRDLARRAA